MKDSPQIITFNDILIFFAKNIKIILAVPSVVCIIAIVYVKVYSEPYYRSVSKFKSSSKQSNESGVSSLAAQFGINLGGGSGQEWSYSNVINSRMLSKKIIKRKFDTKKYGAQKSLMQILTYGLNEPMFQQDTLIIKAVNNFLPMIELKEDPMSGVFTLEVTSFESKLSYDINAAIIDELNNFQSDYNKSRTNKTRLFVEERIIETEKELQIAEEKLKNFRDSNRRLENSPSLKLIQERLSREVFVLTGVFTTLKQQLENVKIEEVKKLDYVIILDEPEIPIYTAGPNNKLIVFLTGLFGIMVGTIIALIQEYIASRDKNTLFKQNKAKKLLKKNFDDILNFIGWKA